MVTLKESRCYWHIQTLTLEKFQMRLMPTASQGQVFLSYHVLNFPFYSTTGTQEESQRIQTKVFSLDITGICRFNTGATSPEGKFVIRIICSFSVMYFVLEDEKERTSYIYEYLSDDFHNFEIKFTHNNSSIHLFKPLIVDSELKLQNGIDVKMNISMIDEENLWKLLLGVDVEIPVASIFDYFVLFRHLKMKKRMYLVCRRLEKVKSLHNLVGLFLKSKEMFEEKETNNHEFVFNDEDHDTSNSDGDESSAVREFNSVFSLAVMNQCKDRLKESRSSKTLKRCFEKHNLMAFLEDSFSISNIIREHPVFEGVNLTIQNESDLLKSNLSYLWKTDSFSNLKIVANDGKHFDAHLEICVLKTNFFFRMVKFPGSEQQEIKEKKSVALEDLDSVVLKSYLEYIYTEEILLTDNFFVLFSILQHAAMYLEERLKDYLLGTIKERTRELVKKKKGVFEFLKKFMPLIGDPDCRSSLFENWSSVGNFDKSLLSSLNDSFSETAFFQRNLKKRESENGELERRVHKREFENGELKKRVDVSLSVFQKLVPSLFDKVQEEIEKELAKENEVGKHERSEEHSLDNDLEDTELSRKTKKRKRTSKKN